MGIGAAVETTAGDALLTAALAVVVTGTTDPCYRIADRRGVITGARLIGITALTTAAHTHEIAVTLVVIDAPPTGVVVVAADGGAGIGTPTVITRVTDLAAPVYAFIEVNSEENTLRVGLTRRALPIEPTDGTVGPRRTAFVVHGVALDACPVYTLVAATLIVSGAAAARELL